MTFEQYFQLIKEDPDTVNFVLNNKNVQLTKDDTEARPFGFINRNAKITYKNKIYNFFNNVEFSKDFIIGNATETHHKLLRDLLLSLNKGNFLIASLIDDKLVNIDFSDQKKKEEILNNRLYRLPIYSHDVFVPCGRIWQGVNESNMNFDFISFWRSDLEITKEMIETILQNSEVDNTRWDNTYLEFSNDIDNKTRLTFGELKDILNKIHGHQKKTNQNSEMAHVAAGIGGIFKNKKGAGSIAQGNKATKARFDNVAEYKYTRLPNQESVQYFSSSL